MDLCVLIPILSLFLLRGSKSRGETRLMTYAKKAMEAMMPTCMAFLPGGQLYGLWGSVSQSHSAGAVTSSSDLLPSSTSLLPDCAAWSGSSFSMARRVSWPFTSCTKPSAILRLGNCVRSASFGSLEYRESNLSGGRTVTARCVSFLSVLTSSDLVWLGAQQLATLPLYNEQHHVLNDFILAIPMARRMDVHKSMQHFRPCGTG